MNAESGLRYAFIGGTALMLAACVTVPKEDLLLTSVPEKRVSVAASPCGALSARDGTGAFDLGILRIISWNIHKAKHADLSGDLASLGAQGDLLLLQEAVHDMSLLGVLEREGFSWQMADAFSFRGMKRGVLSAARIAPVDARSLRTRELLFGLPKSAIVARYRLAGCQKKLVVANLHGINFSLGLGRFRDQLTAVAKELGDHDGPMILSGDFNTWRRGRQEVLDEVTKRLGLVAVEPFPDERRRAFGRHLDYLFVRGFSVVDARSPEMESSDHNPIIVRMIAQCGGDH